MSNFFFTAELMGGLGNQMFQIAHAYSQSLRHNSKSIFRTTSNTNLQGNQVSYYIDNIFRNIQFDNNIQPMKRIMEQDWSHHEINIDEKISTEFYGYYQSSKNFYGFENKIKDLFSPTYTFLTKIYEKYPQLHESKITSIHIRRGDYLNNPSIHPTIDISYLKKAVTEVLDTDHFFIFTDDKIWAKENINLPNVSFIENEYDYEDIWTMSLCHNNIICNSTFSWWGAFLNLRNNKKVICPSVWFGPDGPRNFLDIFEKDWLIIDTKFEDGKIMYTNK
jgi:hypothetical protein